MSRVRLLSRVLSGAIKAAGKVRNPAVRKAVGIKRAVVQSRAATTPVNARAGRTLTPAQRAAASAAKAKANPASKTSIASSRGTTTGSTRAAAGPIKPSSSGTELAKGNEVTKAKPTNYHQKAALKSKAVTAEKAITTNGYRAKPKAQPAGQDFRGYMPSRGRVSPTDQGIAANQQRTVKDRVKAATQGKSGAAYEAARSGVKKADTKARQNAQRDTQARTEQFQRAQEAKSLKGTTPQVRDKMAQDMARRPRVQGPKPAPTTTTGTKRVPANPKSGTATTKTPNGPVKKPISQSPRTLNPETGRPYAASKTPSATRQRGSNPAESRPKASSPTPKGSVQEQNAQRASQIKKAGADEGRKLGIKEEGDYAGQGLNVRSFKPGTPGGVKPVDGRGSSTPAHIQGTSTKDTVQRRGNRNQPIDPETKIRVGSRPVGRLGQPNSRPDTQALRTRDAANKLQREATPSKAPTSPKDSANRQQNLANMRAQRAQARTDRATGRLTNADSKDVKNQVMSEINEKLPRGTNTTKSGEVRLEGSTKGGKYVSGTNSYNDPSGRVPRSGPHDGAPSRTVGKPKGDTRSAEAAKQAEKTVENVRNRRGQGSTTPNRSVDRQGNNLQRLADQALRAIGWSGR